MGHRLGSIQYLEIDKKLKELFYYRESEESEADLALMDQFGEKRNAILKNNPLDEEWNNFLNELKNEFKDLKVRNVTYLHQPSWHGEITLEIQEFGNVATSLNIQFCVSRLSNYFAVIAMDCVKLDRERRIFSENGHKFSCFTPFHIYASPHHLFKNIDKSVREFIQKHFMGFKQLPIEILFEKVPLLTPDLSYQTFNVYDAFFLGEIKHDVWIYYGKKNYPTEDWPTG